MISVEYIDLSAENTTPLMHLRESQGSRSIHVAVSDYDANRLALYNFKVLKIARDGVAENLIKALGAKVIEVVFTLQSSKTVKCFLKVAVNGTISELEARPGEAVLLAQTFEAPIVVEEALFYAKNDTITLKERLRSLSTQEFGHAQFH